jgi:hypothetical protein
LAAGRRGTLGAYLGSDDLTVCNRSLTLKQAQKLELA